MNPLEVAVTMIPDYEAKVEAQTEEIFAALKGQPNIICMYSLAVASATILTGKHSEAGSAVTALLFCELVKRMTDELHGFRKVDAATEEANRLIKAVQNQP